MGFFSSLIRGISKIAKPILGVLGLGAAPAAAAPTIITAGLPAGFVQAGRGLATAAGGAARALGRGAATLPGQLALTGGAAFAGSRLAAPGVAAPGLAPAVIGGPARGNGRFARQTIVETLDLVTGQVVRQETFSGAPFLMNNEVRKLRTVARKLTKAHGKLPRRTQQVSLTSQLKDAAVRKAIEQTQCPTSGHMK